LGFPTGCYLHAIKQIFLALLPGEKEDFCKGNLSLPTFYFVIVLLYFIFACIILSKIQKIVPFIVVIFVGLLLSCFIMLSINGWFL
jgi:hypothetical protein